MNPDGVVESARIYSIETRAEINGGQVYSKTYRTDIQKEDEIIRKSDRGYPLFRDSFSIIHVETMAKLNEAFFKITDAIDSQLDSVDRCNNFDEWKDLLQVLARTALNITTNHRKILGSLIAATRDSDISDFSNGSLCLLQEATNILRKPRVTKQEGKRIISLLCKNDLKVALPLSEDNLDEDSIELLDKMMDTLLEKSHTIK
jgi:hypothetical protein